MRWDREAKPAVSNLLELLAVVRGVKPEYLAGNYSNYGQLKTDVAEAVVTTVRPIQERYRELSGDPAAVQNALADGAARATEVASATLQRAKDAIGLLPR